MANLGFWNLAQANPDYVALVAPDGRQIKSGELLASANRLVHGLRAFGLKKGDTLAILLDNEPAVVEIYLAATQAGFYLTPINVHLAAPEIAYILGDCGAKAFVCSARHGETCARAVAEAGFPENARFSTGHVDGFRPFAELSAGQPSSMPEERNAGMVMNYTSGTTGRPRGVRRALFGLDPDVLAESYASFLFLFGMKPKEGVHLVVAPLYHTAALNFCTYHLHMGHEVVLLHKWGAEDVLRAIDTYKVTNSHMVPTHFSRLLALPDEVKKKYDLSSLRHMIHSAAPCPVAVKERMLDWWGKVIYEYYAASEGGGTLATPEDWLSHRGTVGKPWPISKIKILDDAGNVAPVRQVGTVYIHMGPYKFEYHKDQKKTDSAWKEDFFTVGDAGYLDEDGFLYLSDRKSDMIISGGVNIYPAEIESAMLAHADIEDIAVFGVPDEDWGESVKAVIQTTPGTLGTPALAAEILAWCKDKIASYKIPRTIDFIAEMPRDPNGKLYKRKLRDPYWVGRERAI